MECLRPLLEFIVDLLPTEPTLAVHNFVMDIPAKIRNLPTTVLNQILNFPSTIARLFEPPPEEPILRFRDPVDCEESFTEIREHYIMQEAELGLWRRRAMRPSLFRKIMSRLSLAAQRAGWEGLITGSVWKGNSRNWIIEHGEDCNRGFELGWIGLSLRTPHISYHLLP
ncbi:hypothetical protein BCR34DRAFT_596969 [Clohesyomyces aquaticus]|uniref:Uncharacterized protein n=1 Tax=Clohesyomyces aquaticus TaxID=1231657 RepID=A0A1Y2A4Q4_9PLEO|nr:hypothetical protein BCR34DRAFT_596969 [Clohesyomyces aquaticus]